MVHGKNSGSAEGFYAEETLTFSLGNVVEVEGLLRYVSTGEEWEYSGEGTFTADGDYLSINIDLSQNEISSSDDFTLNGSYTIDGNLLTIESNNIEYEYYKQ